MSHNTATTTTWTRRRKIFWSVLAALSCSFGILAFITRAKPRLDPMPDFVQEWTSGRSFLAGGPVYGDLHKMVAAHLPAEQVGELAIRCNVHPPFSVLMTLPLALLDYADAFLLWNLLSVAAMLVSLWLIIGRYGLQLSAWTWLPVLAVILPSFPFAGQTFQGQFNLVLLLFITAASVAERHGRMGVSGALLGAAAAIKLFPAFLFVYFLAQRRWSAIVLGGITFLLLNAAAAATFGVGVYDQYFTEALPHANAYYDQLDNASVAGFWTKLLDASRPNVIPLWNSPLLARAATLLCITLLTVVCAWKSARAGDRTERDRAFGLCTIAMLLCCPIAWTHYFLLLLPAIIGLSASIRGAWLNRTTLTALTLALAINPWLVWRVSLPGDGPYVVFPVHTLTIASFQLFALVGLFCMASLQGSTSPQRSSRTWSFMPSFKITQSAVDKKNG